MILVFVLFWFEIVMVVLVFICLCLAGQKCLKYINNNGEIFKGVSVLLVRKLETYKLSLKIIKLEILMGQSCGFIN
jgi:hypothetical protein